MIIFYIALFVIAFLYASVGHGGASGYLALMALYGIAPEVMRPSALMLNLFVSSVSFYQFYRGGHFKLQLFWPLAIASVPMAFVGGLLHIDASLYKQVLGVLLIIAVARFFFFGKVNNTELKEPQLIPSLIIGGAIGFLIWIDRYRRWYYSFPGPAFVEMVEHEADRCYQRLIYLCKLCIRIDGPGVQGNQFQLGHGDLCYCCFCGWIVRRVCRFVEIKGGSAPKCTGCRSCSSSVEIIIY